jgi:hypothetical protein
MTEAHFRCSFITADSSFIPQTLMDMFQTLAYDIGKGHQECQKHLSAL